MQELPNIDAVLIDALEHASEAFVIYDKDLNVVHCNGNFRTMYGYSEEQSKPGTPMRQLIDLDVANGNFPIGLSEYNITDYLLKRRSVENTPDNSFEYQLNDGRWISISERSTSSGGLVSIQRDITHRKKTDEELLKRNRLFQTAFNADQSACSISVLETGEFLDVNDTWLRARNLKRDEAIGRTALELNVWGSPQKREEVVRQVRLNKHKGRYETSVTRPDGTVRYVVLTWDVITVNHQECLFLSTTDVTAGKEVEMALQLSLDRFSDFSRASSDWYWESDSDNRYTYLSPIAEKSTGRSEAEFLGKTHVDLREEDGEDWQETDKLIWQKFQKREAFRDIVVRRWHKETGQKIWLRISGKPYFDRDGSFEGFRGSSTDITSQVDLEERLQQSHKMEMIGQLTGGIAHDFNNLLAVIQGNAELIQEAAEAGKDILPAQLDSILHASKRGAELTQSMLAFSRKQTLNPIAIRLDHHVGQMTEMLRRTLGETIQIETEAEEKLWYCEADEGKVETALLNLGINARDAMPNGGKLSIRLNNCLLKASDLTDHPDVEPGRYVALSVEDTGSGIAKEHLDHVFEPFFTTKETGRGTGLGLSMVYGFAQQSRGHLTICSVLEKGTKVTLYLPYADPSKTE